MDKIQIYYTLMLLLTFCHTLYGFATVKNAEQLGDKIGQFLVTVLMIVPVAGRIYLWW